MGSLSLLRPSVVVIQSISTLQMMQKDFVKQPVASSHGFVCQEIFSHTDPKSASLQRPLVLALLESMWNNPRPLYI